MKISFILGLNLILLCIFLLKYLETKEVIVFNLSIDQCCMYINFILVCIEILFMVFYNDLYFVFVMILFKLGVVLENLTTYKKDNKFTLVYFIISLFFFISFNVLSFFKNEDDLEKKEIETISKVYKQKLILTSE
jgi:hypothetical protein